MKQAELQYEAVFYAKGKSDLVETGTSEAKATQDALDASGLSEELKGADKEQKKEVIEALNEISDPNSKKEMKDIKKAVEVIQEVKEEQ